MQENSVNSARYMHMMIHCWVVFKYVPIPIIESTFLNFSWGSFRAGAEVRRCLHSSSSRLLCKTSGEMTRDIKRHQETRSCTENQVSRLKWIRLNKYFLYQRYTLDHFSVLDAIFVCLKCCIHLYGLKQTFKASGLSCRFSRLLLAKGLEIRFPREFFNPTCLQFPCLQLLL